MSKKSIINFSLLIYIFWAIIVILSIYIFCNTHNTNKFTYEVIDKTINQSNAISPDSLIKFVEELNVNKDWWLNNKILIRIDTANLKVMRDISQQLLLNQRSFIDGNGLTFIIGILSLFLIGLGIFGIQFFHNKVEKIEEENKNGLLRLSKQIKISASTNKITNFSEIVYAKAIGLEKISDTKAENEICRVISSRLVDIQIDINTEKNKPYVIERMSKQNSLELLHQVKNIFISKGYNTKSGYLKDIYNRLILTIELINDLNEAKIE